VNDVDTPRASFLTRLSAADGAGTAAPGPPPLSRDVTPNAILARIDDLAGYYHRFCLIRGCPDDWITYDSTGKDSPAAGMLTALRAFGSSLLNNGVVLRCLARAGGPDASPLKAIRDIDWSGANSPKIIFNVPGHNFPELSRVRIRGVTTVGEPPENVNGVWRVLFTGLPGPMQTDWFAIDLNATGPLLPVTWRYWTGGKVSLRKIIYRPMDALPPIQFERYSQRKTGGPFLRRRGHPSAVRRQR